jgi:outer membrane protein TolC
MRHFKCRCIFSFLLVFTFTAFADHSNEGRDSISQLMEEAQLNNLEIKQAEENVNALKLKRSSLYASFVPKISLEGGSQSTNFDGVKSSGSELYGKADWNLYNGGFDGAKIDLLNAEFFAQEKLLKFLKNKINCDVSKLYFELQYLLESISLKQKALDLNAHQMKIAKSKNKSGLTTSSDVLEFDLRGSTLQCDLVLLNQELDQKYRELDVFFARKNSALNQGVSGHLVRENFSVNRETLLQKIQESNDQLLLTKIKLMQDEMEKKQSQSKFLPKLDLEARYGKLASDDTVFKEKNNYAVMLKFNIPLFSGFEDYNAVNSLSSKVLASQISLEQKKMSLTAILDSTLSEIKALNTRLDLEEKNLEKSEQYYKLTLSEYIRGVKNSPDMVGASERLLEARIRNLEYRRNLMLAKTKIKELTGE